MVVDIDNYDVLFGLDFLIKIGAIVDVERNLIQIKHGLGANVEVLSLTMVNLLQGMNSKTLMWGYYYYFEEWSFSDDSDITNWIPDQGSPIKTKRENTFALDSNTSIDNNEHCDEEPRQFEQIDCENELRDTEIEDLVRSKGLQLILQLILQE